MLSWGTSVSFTKTPPPCETLGMPFKKVKFSKKCLVPVSVRYGGYLGYRYRFGMGDFGHIGIGISVSYRFLKGNICKQLPGIGIIQIYWYHTDISVSVWWILGISVSV